MADKEATVRVGLEGSDDVARGMEGIGASSESAGAKVKGALGGAAREVGGHIKGLISDSIRLATAMNGLSLGTLVEGAKRGEMAFQRLSIGSGRTFGEIKQQVRDLSLNALLDPAAAEGMVKTFGKVTYSIGDAAKRLQALNAEAVASGRDLGDELPLGQALAAVGVKAEDTQEVLGRLAAQADKLGTIGGPAALRDAMAAAGGAIQQIGAKSAEAQAKVSALIGVLGKGYGPEQQKQIGASVLGAMQSRYIDIERSTGMKIRNADGTFNEDKMAAALQAFRDRAMKHLGRSRGELALGNFFGSSVVGAAVSNADFSQMKGLIGLDPSKAGPAAAQALLASEAGKGARTDIANQQAGADAVKPVVDAQRGWASMFSGNPLLGVGAGIGAGALAQSGLNAAGRGLLSLLGAPARAAATAGRVGAGLLTGGAGAGAGAAETGALSLGEAQAELAAAEMFGKTNLAAGAGGAWALAGGAGAAMLGWAGYGLSQTRRDSAMGRRAQARQRSALATELAGQVARGEMGSDFYGQVVPSLVKKSGGDEATMREVLQILSKQQLPPNLAKDIGVAVAEALRQNPPQIQVAGGSPTDASVQQSKADGAGSTAG